MRKTGKLAIVALSALSAVALSVGITYAATYKSPAENTVYTFDNPNQNFQPLGYYFAGGNGTLSTPFLIKNSQQLRNLAKLQNAGAMPNGTYVSLGTSFQFEGAAMEPIGTSSNPWTGVFNGDNHAITGLKVTSSTYTDVGMFGRLGTNDAAGKVHSLVLVGPSVTYTGSSAVNLSLLVGYRNNTSGHESEVYKIEIYGGTANYSNFRAHIKSSKALTGGTSGTSHSGNAIIGVNYTGTGIGTDSGSRVGFVNVLSATPTYTSNAAYTSNIAANTDVYLYHNGTGVTAG